MITGQSTYQAALGGLSLFRTDGVKKAAAALPSSVASVLLGVWTARQRLSLFALSALTIVDCLADDMRNLFNGRIGRKEFWIGYIPLLLACVASLLLASDSKSVSMIFATILVFGFLQTILVFWRLHDINRSGANIFIGAIPLGGFYLLYLFLKKGAETSNIYGEHDTRRAIIYTRAAHIFIYLCYILSIPILIGYLTYS